jgi:hypothetical protein
MLRRWFFPLVALFWVTMNVLLWRSEMSGRADAGSAVPVAFVWERILSAPDDSSLQILQAGRKIGFCRWVANVGENPTDASVADAASEPEGRVRRLAGYTLDFDGNVMFADPPERFRFNAHAAFGPDQAWRRAVLKLVTRPQTLEVHADAGAETVSFKVGAGSSAWERTFTFAELSRPETLLAGLGAPAGLAWLAPLGAEFHGAAPSHLELGLEWTARQDWLNLGHGARTRVFRLEARLDKYRAVVIVSRVGEILRVELPDHLVLVNDAIASL